MESLKKLESSRGSLVIVDCAVEYAENQVVERLKEEFNQEVIHCTPGLEGWHELPTIGPQSRIIVLGSFSSVHDALPWHGPVIDLLLQQAKKGVPVLGICFAHQLLAHHFGGKVDFAREDKSKVTGWRRVCFERDFGHIEKGDYVKVCATHFEAVTSLPEEFGVLARCEDAPFDALIHHHLPIATFQTHPEGDKAFISRQTSIEDTETLDAIFCGGQRIVTAFRKQWPAKTS